MLRANPQFICYTVNYNYDYVIAGKNENIKAEKNYIRVNKLLNY